MSDTPVPIFVINLACAPQRRAWMTQQLADHGFLPEFVTAIDGRKLDAQTQDFWQSDPLRAKLSPGEIGCMLSHRKVWQHIVDQQLDRAIVLEDDLVLGPNFRSVAHKLNIALNALGLVRLEGDRRTVVLQRDATDRVDAHGCHLLRRDRPIGCGAYAVSNRTARKMLEAAPRFREPVDAELFAAKRSSMADLPTYQLVPAIGTQANFVPQLLAEKPFLASSIAAMGERVDDALGIHKPRKNSHLQSLRPIYRLMRNIALAPRGWRLMDLDTIARELR